MTKTTRAQPEVRNGKRPYARPKLIVHGDLRKITLAKGSIFADGSGVPKTRTVTIAIG